MSTMVMEQDTGEHGFLEDDDVRTYGRHASGMISEQVEELRFGKHDGQNIRPAGTSSSVAALVARLDEERAVVPDDITEIMTSPEPVKGVTLSPRYLHGTNSEADAEATQGFKPIFGGAAYRSRLPGDPGFAYDEPPIGHATGATEVSDSVTARWERYINASATASPVKPSRAWRLWRRIVALAGV